MGKIIAQMVGHNEADRFLPEVLSYLKDKVDVIVFTDDASTDSTPDIAEDFGAFVYRNDEQMFTVNEGKLRGNAWNNLSNHAEYGDWVLCIDCDEKLYTVNNGSAQAALRKLVNQDAYDVINVQFVHMWNRNQYRADKLWAPHPSQRLFKYFIGGSFPDRALACGSEPSYVRTLVNRGRYMRDSGLVMQHLGYVRDNDKIAKYERYMKLDGGEFHNGSHIQSIIDDNPVLLDWTINDEG